MVRVVSSGFGSSSSQSSSSSGFGVETVVAAVVVVVVVVAVVQCSTHVLRYRFFLSTTAWQRNIVITEPGNTSLTAKTRI